jgi:phosphoglycerate dehydrogenase-like enzyme
MATTRPTVVALCGGLMDSIPAWDDVRSLTRLKVAASEAELARLLPAAEILFVWDFRFDLLDQILPSAPALRWIHVAGVGVDAVVSPVLAAHNVILTNSRGIFDDSIAEYVAALLLASVKDLAGTWRLQTHHQWQHRTTKMLKNMRVAVVGTGSIGRHIASLLSALGARVVLVGRREATDPELGRIAPSSRLAEIAGQSDALVLAAPLTSLTRGMVDRTTLTALGPDGYLVNVGRGALIVESDLVAALSAGELGGAALDVFEHEPLSPSSPLWAMPNVVISPHMSGDFDGYEHALVRDFVANLLRWTAGMELDNIVDLDLGYVPSN